MKKRWLALLLCLVMLPVFQSPSAAAGEVYFVGAEDNILPLSDSTMPFWKNKYLYIPGNLFTGNTRNALEISSSTAKDGSWVALYWGERAILFEKDKAYGQDAEGRLYYPGAEVRGGTLFVPVAAVANYFGLEYSVRKVDHGWLVWLRKSGFGLSDAQFADAAATMLNQRYAEYISAKKPAQPAPPAQQPGQEDPTFSGKRIYLCARESENLGILLDVLDRYHARMSFFCTPEFLEQNGALLRRMTVDGYTVGLLADGSRSDLTVSEQLRAGNEALERATCQKTRLVRIENAAEGELEAARAAGYCVAPSEMTASRYTLRNTYQANQLFRSVAATRGTSVVWLEDGMSTVGLDIFLKQALQAQDDLIAVTETTKLR